MSTRAQVYIEDTGVYLYQHYDGDTLPDEVKAALKRGKDRWDDDEYLTRIIFCEMVKHHVEDLTGYGIGTTKHGDIEYLVIVNCEKQTVSVNHSTKGEIESYSFVDVI